MRTVPLALVIVIVAGSVPFLAWGAWPLPIERQVLLVQPGQVGIMASGPTIPGQRRLTLEVPHEIRCGDSGVISLTLDGVAPDQPAPTDEIGGQGIEAPNVYLTHNVIAEAELDLAGAEIRPAGPISEPLLPGESAKFFWRVRPMESAAYRGTVWFALVLVDKATREETRVPLSAQTVRIECTRFLGLDGGNARTAGAFGCAVGMVLAFPSAAGVFKRWRPNVVRQFD